uniref:Uncharacterized protein n=1 Tax=viral metagenome TaxID=1070528 RepID=A0A6C0CAF4_9ZZZZ
MNILTNKCFSYKYYDLIKIKEWSKLVRPFGA